MKNSIFKKIFQTSIVIVFFVLITMFINVSAEEKPAFTFEKKAITDVVVKELNIPAKFNFSITNNNIFADYFSVYSLVYLRITPATPIYINPGETKNFVLTALPFGWLKEKGVYSIEYYIKSEKGGYVVDNLIIKVLSLSETLFVKVPETIERDASQIVIEITNKENIDLGEAQLFLDSQLFSATKNITIGPKSKQNITLELEPTKIKIARAGDYPIKIIFFLNKEYNYTVESKITLLEQVNIVTQESSQLRFFGFKKTIIKKNDGNTARLVTIELVKGRFERAFSYFNIPPTIERPSLLITTLVWQRQLEPGESLVVEATTDYTLLVIILAALIILVVTLYLKKRPRVIVKKKAIRIRAKGGEFALKLILFVKNIGGEVKDVVLVDRIPSMVKLYERFNVKPDKIERNKLEWNLGSLMPNEERVFSYIIYSKVVPVGSIELPRAVLYYTDKKRKACYSNKLFIAVHS